MSNELPQNSVVLLLLLSLGACTTPEPVLRSNEHLESRGEEGAEQDVLACDYEARQAGLTPRVSRSDLIGGMAGGFVIGAALGAAVGAGASEWTSDGDGSIAISAAVGGGLVAVAVLAGAGYRWLFPDVAYDDFVVSCLTKMGYEVGGWE